MSSIIDSMYGGYDTLEEIQEEVIIPKRCSTCKCQKICSVLPTFIALGKMGIFAGIETCPYYSISESKRNEDSTEL